jgi:hypothetical protein
MWNKVCVASYKLLSLSQMRCDSQYKLLLRYDYQPSWRIWKNHLTICFDEIWEWGTGEIMKIAFTWEITPRSTIDGRPSIIPRGNRYFRNVHTHLPNFTALRSNLTCCQYDRYPVRDMNFVRPEFKLGAVLLTWKETWRWSGSCVWVWSWKASPLTGCLGFLGICRRVLLYSHNLSYVCLITRFYQTVIRVVQVEDIQPLHLKRRR